MEEAVMSSCREDDMEVDEEEAAHLDKAEDNGESETPQTYEQKRFDFFRRALRRFRRRLLKESFRTHQLAAPSVIRTSRRLSACLDFGGRTSTTMAVTATTNSARFLNRLHPLGQTLLTAGFLAGPLTAGRYTGGSAPSETNDNHEPGNQYAAHRRKRGVLEHDAQVRSCHRPRKRLRGYEKPYSSHRAQSRTTRRGRAGKDKSRDYSRSDMPVSRRGRSKRSRPQMPANHRRLKPASVHRRPERLIERGSREKLFERKLRGRPITGSRRRGSFVTSLATIETFKLKMIEAGAVTSKPSTPEQSPVTESATEGVVTEGSAVGPQTSPSTSTPVSLDGSVRLPATVSSESAGPGSTIEEQAKSSSQEAPQTTNSAEGLMTTMKKLGGEGSEDQEDASSEQVGSGGQQEGHSQSEGVKSHGGASPHLKAPASQRGASTAGEASQGG